MREVNLLLSLPKSNRNITKRSVAKTPELIKEAKEFARSYFDGTREQGYGGYAYDGRWVSVARDIIKFFGLREDSEVLDVGCAKGFLIHDLITEGISGTCGLDISEYALQNSMPQVKRRLHHGTADNLPFPNDSFDLVISINTLHNLPRAGVIRALKEMQRVSRGDSYIVVDSYNTPEEKAVFEGWCLTAETHMYPHEWEELFSEAGYTGFYSWNML